MKFVRATVEYTAAMAIVLVLLLNTGVFAYSAKTTAAQASPSPLGNKHGYNSIHTSTKATSAQESNQTQSQDDQNGNGNQGKGNGNGEAGNQNGQNESRALHFTLYTPSNANNGKDDRGQASIAISGNTLNVEIEVKKTSPSTTFSVVLIAIPMPTTTGSTTTSTTTVFSTTMFSTTTFSTSTSTSTSACVGSIGTFITNGDGRGEAELSTTLSSGTYALGLVLCSNNVPLLVTHPTTRTAAVPQGTRGQGHDSSSANTTGDNGDQNGKVNAVTKSGNDDKEIMTAMSDKTIPVVISVLNSGASLHQLDSRFSVAASKLDGSGLMISISAQNVTGSRVLLVNLTGSQWSTSSLQSLKVTFDGASIAKAASLSQVLNSTSADPARYIIMLSSSGLQLLVSIPHFSLHTIQIIPTIAPTTDLFSLNGALLVGALVLFTALSVAAYSKRGRIYAFLK